MSGKESLQLKREVQQAVKQRIQQLQEKRALNQAGIAEDIGLTQPRLSALMNDHVELFSLEKLIDIAGKSGLTVRMDTSRPYRYKS